MYTVLRSTLRRTAAAERSSTALLHRQRLAALTLRAYTATATVFHQPLQHFSSSAPLFTATHRLFSTQPAAVKAEVKWTTEGAKLVNGRLKFLPRDYEVRSLAIEAGLNPEEWAVASAAFRQSFMKEPEVYFQDQDELAHFIKDFNHGQKKGNAFVFYPHFLSFANEKNYIPRGDAGSFTLQQITDLRLPHELYPRANAMKRRIIYHEGPTNSGKTYQALERLKKAGEDGGLYCGPLRLLALEVYERMNMDGIYTSLVTGQEKKIIPHASHVSCTVEMANINRKWDVAVVDEIQLIGDPQRGWAWTRALFGLQANEIHVCGSGEAADLVEKFAAATGDSFEMQRYERRSPLEIDAKHLNSFRHVKPGDCVVAFSRREIFQIKRDIEVKSGQKCCIIYGQLPPETRSQQARLFNAQDNDFNVLVASDAVGMGLNLNIGRVVFSTVKKYNGAGGGMTDISPSLAKQIAGRAGRFGSAFEAGGLATTLAFEDLKYLRDSYEAPLIPLKSAGIFPSSEQMEEFAKQLPGVTDLGDLLDKYVTLARLDGDYFMCNHVDMKDAASLLCEIKMKLSDRFTFCQAPANLRNPLARRVFVDYARAHASDESVKLDIYLPRYAPQTADTLRDVEIKAQIIDLYLWLSFRFETTFVEHELALEMKARALQLVEEGLVNTTYHSKTAKRQLRQSGSHQSRNHQQQYAARSDRYSGERQERKPQQQRTWRAGEDHREERGGRDFGKRVHERIIRGIKRKDHNMELQDEDVDDDFEAAGRRWNRS